MRTRRIALTLLSLIIPATFAAADFYNRAPDTLPGLIPEMNDPSWWTARIDNPDELILTSAEIQSLNKRHEKRMADPDRFKGIDPERVPKDKDLNRWPGRCIVMPDLISLSSSELARVIRTEIKHDIDFLEGKYMKDIEGLEYVEAQNFGDILGIAYSSDEIAELVAEMALDTVPAKPNLMSGLTVCDALLRVVPSMTPDQVGLMENGKTRWDVWNVNVVRIASPVTVLHVSASGGHLFVLSPEGYGWIKTEDIAFCDANTLREFTETKDFVVCTGDRVAVFTDPTCRYATRWFRMGDRLPLASSGDKRRVKLPSRTADGSLVVDTAWLAKDAQVSVGYLPYTRRNIVTTAFTMLGNRYDWTMAWLGRNHETTLRDLFACFGFNLPFNAELFTFYGDNTRVVMPDEGKEAQYKAIMANEPFVTIQTCGGGHSQLYLGKYNGEPVVLDTHGYGYEGDDGKYYEVRRLVVGEMSLPAYFLKTPFTFLELK